MMARLATHEHVVQHLFNDPEISCITDEIGAVFGVTRAAERHVVTQNIVFYSVFVDNGGQGLVRC